MQKHDTPTAERLDGRRSVERDPRICQNCGCEFIPKRQTKGLFCSVRCYRLWWGQNGQAEASKKGLAKLEELQAAGKDPRASQQATWKRRMAFRNSALTMAEDEHETDDFLWAERGQYWQEQVEPKAKKVISYRRHERKPLILNGHGLRMHVNYGSLVVRHGFTHYPQAAREQRFFPGDPKLPSRIILLSTNGSLSLDVVRWLSEQRVSLVMLDYRGRVVSVLGTETTSADLALRRAQIEAITNGRGLVLARSLIEQKLAASITTLETLPASEVKESAIKRITALLKQLQAKPPQSIDDLRHLEAWAAIPYFGAWRAVELRWKGTARKPIPPEWRRIGVRQDFLRRTNRHAHHPVNTLLNYGYALLESQVRIALAEVGLDPTIGYLHVCQAGRDSFIYDLMEPYRPVVDRDVLGFVRSQTFTPRDFVIDKKGVCRLHPELARLVASLASEAVASLQLEIGTLRE